MASNQRFVVKNGLTTQNIEFVDSINSTNNSILLSMLESDTISFTGDSGQLFSISDTMEGAIFSVNDVSGIPSIEVLDTGQIKLGQYGGNVLIGTGVDNGIDRLQVNGSMSITELSVVDRIVHTGDTNTTIRFPAADTISMETNGVERMRILSTGQIGIGLTTPAEALDVVGNIKIQDNGIIYSNGNLTLSADNNNTAAASVINLNVDGLEVADFTNAGYLRFNRSAFAGGGICTQQNNSVLALGGGENPLNNGINIGLSGPNHVSATAGILVRDTTTIISGWNRGGDFHFWHTGAAERLRITSTGNVGIGTSTPASRLQVIGEVTATDFNSISDRTSKTDILKIENALNKLKLVNGYTFTFKDTGKRSAGVIAQELKNILPEAVQGEEGSMTVAYDNIIGLLIEAIKEQSVKIEELEERLNISE